ncbi:hypothetical protein PAAG_05296 [Paracoccidioides lutzii Pb01]|uniref:Choline kinase N-terminal domain-containing protein n=1 Tax=Paracoccidioides lutzii (strain ATCC MYA-826 / Pb01) TaxID=502779 RepID=C1H3F3_PARBA|nr:hypothetical protein PAAG_05296 [Paracoccidioides lutzii Pb01]EEH34247.2 hypothetical protein PAAG_05296 [Paracoccidioides lutzii Pb01]
MGPRTDTTSPQCQPTTGDLPGRPGVESRPIKQHRASTGRRVTARPAPHSSPPSMASLGSLSTQIQSFKFESVIQDESDPEMQGRNVEESSHAQLTLLAQVRDWLQQEKAKSSVRRMKKTGATESPVPAMASGDATHAATRQRSDSQCSDGTLALEKLEQILAQYPVSGKEGIPSTVIRRKRSSISLRRRTSTRSLRRGSISDSNYSDADQAVPNANVALDNSKTLLYGGGEADSDFGNQGLNKPASKDKEHWIRFKYEIVRLTHTLGLRGWRRVPIEDSRNIEVVRLSGALTNAVYVVSPPQNSPSTSSLAPKRPPPQLLLRIYGPQVEHLIDRKNELQILRRLAKRNIGPRVLGSFNNGRFEQYFHARTLTPKDIRNPETSKQIAKRMRELHDGIELLPEEIEGGPSIWKNWDKWVERCKQVASWLDREIMSSHNQSKSETECWRRQGFVCGLPWPKFRMAVDAYRKWLVNFYGGAAAINQQLIFAHNDTQYGNLLRLEPSGESPLLLPPNEHKQLVVIDFEYASANTRGLEFCNHFTEWCYNYHDPDRPWACNTKWYPTPEEQERFVRAYLNHRPHIIQSTERRDTQSAPTSVPDTSTSSSAVGTPVYATHSNSPRLSPFMLDSQDSPIQPSSRQVNDRADQALDLEIRSLLRETLLWRAANSAQWVAWGIVQAKITGMEEALAAAASASAASTTTEKQAPETMAEMEETSTAESNDGSDHLSEIADEHTGEFDYLAYAQDRALFFWADMLSLGLIKESELPTDMAERIKGHVIGY